MRRSMHSCIDEYLLEYGFDDLSPWRCWAIPDPRSNGSSKEN